MGTGEVALSLLALVVVWQQGMMLMMQVQHRRQLEDARAQLDRVLVMQRAETLAEFAAVNDRMAKARLESVRGEYVPPQTVGEAGAAPRRRTTLDLLWRRPRTTTAPNPAPEE